MYSSRNTDYIQRLIALDKHIFRTSELALIWGISNRNTLHKTLSRYQKKSVLFRIQIGIYSTLPYEKLHPYEMACAVSGPLSYITCETVLANEGLIAQSVPKITLAGKNQVEYTVYDKSFLCRYLNQKYLVNRIGIIQKNNYAIATPIRAIADMLHIIPKYHIDGMDQIDYQDLHKIQIALNYV